MSNFVCRTAVAAAFPFLAFTVSAQQAPVDADAKAPKKLETVTVTATPLSKAVTEMAQPATVLTDEDLRRKRAASIGDTLSQEVGVQSSSFGPGAGRPIIRGLDGPRIRVLENGLGTLDVSTVSPDHMVTTESLHADQIEILRGPASLLYGSGAIGGVVNVVSNLIPRSRVAESTGDVEARFGTANREKTGSANLNAGTGNFAMHVDGFSRTAGDYEIPGHAVRDDPSSPSGQLPGTFMDARGAGVGASWVGDRGYLGIGTEGLKNNYGVPSGEGSHIDLRQSRYEFSGELADPFAGFTRAKFRIGHADYQHQEIESTGEVATTFKNKSTEGRVELTHALWSGITGAIGVQAQDGELSALGEEAIIPKTKSRGLGIFLVEQKSWEAWTLDGGLRYERATRRPDGDLPNRDFTLGTASAGLVWKFSPDYRASVNLTTTQRAPTAEELYSFGAHGATVTFDIGSPDLAKESARNIDLTLQRVAGEARWKVNLFMNRIRNYVYAASVDANGDGVADRVDDEGTLTPDGEFLVQRFSQAGAKFRGVEAEWRYRPADRGIGVRVFGDLVRARLDDGTNLPRISPARVGLSFDGRNGAWSSYLSFVHAYAQKRVSPLETTTPGYTRVDAEVAYAITTEKGRELTLFLQASNLLDQEIRVHTSYLKDIAPLMGRSFTLGLRGEF